MTIQAFPPVESADEHGLLAVGGDLEVASLLLAYTSGIFPWPFNQRTLAWFSPPKRALIFLNEVHVSRSTRRALNKHKYTIKRNTNFSAVITACSKKSRRGQRGTWITPAMIRAYGKLHEAGYAHSFESYRDNTLVGGVYGVSIGGMFAAESMFYDEPAASKAALLSLFDHLKEQGVAWVDIQVINEFTESLGAKEIERNHYLALLQEALSKQKITL